MKNIVKKVLSAALAASMALSLAACSGGNNAAGSASASGSAGSASQAEGGKEYKVGIVKFMDHASLDQIESSVQQELDAKSAELGVTFNYADYTFNGQGDSTTLNQIAAQLVDDGVDVVVPIATPAAQVMQSVVTEKDIPIVFAAVSDPVTAKLVSSRNFCILPMKSSLPGATLATPCRCGSCLAARSSFLLAAGLPVCLLW